MRKVVNLSYTVPTNNLPSNNAPDTALVRRVSRKDNRVFTDMVGKDGLPVTFDLEKVPTSLRKGVTLHFNHVTEVVEVIEPAAVKPPAKSKPDTHGCDGNLVLRF